MALSTIGPPSPAEIEIGATMRRYPSLAFALPPSVLKFSPRIGRLTLTREDGGDDDGTGTTATRGATVIAMDTPNVLVGTSRGVVPHFSCDHTNGSDAIQWINVPFESFLEQVPPIPTLQDGPRPLHRFLGFDENRHITSLSLRDPLDVREMPPNGNTHVSANCVRGVKKVSLSDWRTYVSKMQPDVVFGLTDTPFTPPPHSQKRITRNIERSTAWLADMLRPLPSDPDPDPSVFASASPTRLSRHHLNVFVHMAGMASIPAREAFAHGLGEMLHGPDAEAVRPLRCLDEGISGYSFDLAVLRGLKPTPNTSQHQCLPDGFLRLEQPDVIQHSEPIVDASTPSTTIDGGSSTPLKVLQLSIAESSVQPDIASLLKASLGTLSERKPRLVTGVRSPHEMLRLIRDVGVDLFDVGWAIHAANLGVALDFAFPVPVGDEAVDTERRRHVGHNLYDPVYARQFRCLADARVAAAECPDGGAAALQDNVCPCIACSPRSPVSHILHSTVDRQSYTSATTEQGIVRYERPYTRAYIHHLLHTHEMSAHTLLVGHNLAIVSAFLAGVRQVWTECGGAARFAFEVARFHSAYNESGELFVDAKKDWECVARARGKGRLARERENQKNGREE